MSTQKTDLDPRFSPPAEEVYRPISTLAVVSLVLALISLLAFASPFFLLFSVLGGALALWSMWILSRMRAEYAGEMIAQIALLLALISGLGSTTSFVIQSTLLTREAETWADEFLDRLLEHRMKEAFVYLLPPANRPGEDEVDELITRFSVNYRQFLDKPFVRVLEGQGKEAQVTKYGGVAFHPEVEGTTEVTLQYAIDLPDRTVGLLLTMRGAVAPKEEWEGRAWYVYDARMIQAAKSSAEPSEEKPHGDVSPPDITPAPSAPANEVSKTADPLDQR